MGQRTYLEQNKSKCSMHSQANNIAGVMDILTRIALKTTTEQLYPMDCKKFWGNDNKMIKTKKTSLYFFLNLNSTRGFKKKPFQ